MRAVVVLAVASLASCYKPSTPSGAYQCAADTSCPVGQTCECGQCVNNVADAACSFVVDTDATAPVSEHQQLSITVRALNAAGNDALGYSGTVALSFELSNGAPWCDVTPAKLKLDKGAATAMVALNRETVPPQKPKLTARALAAKGQSDGVVVIAPPFVRDPAPIVAPLAAGGKFGWGESFVGLPSILPPTSARPSYLMYYSSLVKEGALRYTTAIGVATSSDGHTFTPTAAPVVVSPTGISIASPAAFETASGVTLAAFAELAGIPGDFRLSIGDILRITSPDGMSNWTAPVSVLAHKTSCPSYCNIATSWPSVVGDPAAPVVGGLPTAWLMFFAATDIPAGTLKQFASVGLATSVDGNDFVAEAAPVINGDLGGESSLFAPQVYIDGSVYKMWYSFVRQRDATVGASVCNFKVSIGYATSTDGRFWVRSPANSPNAPLEPSSDPLSWENGESGLIAGAVLADASSPGGMALYYSTMRPVDVPGVTGSQCLVNGIGRAVRP